MKELLRKYLPIESLFRGNISLRETYWYWFVVGGFLLELPAFLWMTGIVFTTDAAFEYVGLSLNLSGQILEYNVRNIPIFLSRLCLLVLFALRIPLVIFRLFMTVAIWNSAGKFPGRKLWPILARVSAIVVGIGNFAELHVILLSPFMVPINEGTF